VPSRNVAAGASGDLSELGGAEPAELVAVELAVGGEGDMIEIEIEAHADGIGRHQEIDVARLEDLDLALRVRGLSEPRTTAAPPRWRRINSAMA